MMDTLGPHKVLLVSYAGNEISHGDFHEGGGERRREMKAMHCNLASFCLLIVEGKSSTSGPIRSCCQSSLVVVLGRKIKYGNKKERRGGMPQQLLGNESWNQSSMQNSSS
jgi:hypothetical protein